MTGKNNKSEPRQLPANYKLSRFDVICARGKLAQEHEGNIRMKALVQSCLPQYSQTTCKVTKSRLVSSVVDSVRQASPEGGFVKFVDDGWVIVNDRFAREKVGQQFRDLLHTKYRSSTKAKARARMQQTGSPTSADSINGCTITDHNTIIRSAHFPAAIPSSIAACATPSLPATANNKVAVTAMLANLNKAYTTEPRLMSSAAMESHSETVLVAQLLRVRPCETTDAPSAAVPAPKTPMPMPMPSSHVMMEPLIQPLERSVPEGANGFQQEYCNTTMKASATAPFSTTNTTGAIIVQGERPKNWLHNIPSGEYSAILSDLEPTPIREDLRDSYSFDAFIW